MHASTCSEARVGGMLGGKAGLVHVHMGTGEAQLQPLYGALEASDVPIAQFLPTHMERNPSLVNEAKRWIEHGGCVDFTAGAKVGFVCCREASFLEDFSCHLHRAFLSAVCQVTFR